MNIPRRLALVCALTLAVVACSDDKNNPNYTGMGPDAGLPGGNDQVNGNSPESGIQETPRGNFNPNRRRQRDAGLGYSLLRLRQVDHQRKRARQAPGGQRMVQGQPGPRALPRRATPTSAAPRNTIAPWANAARWPCANISSASACPPPSSTRTATALIVPPSMATRKKPTPRIAALKSAWWCRSSGGLI